MSAPGGSRFPRAEVALGVVTLLACFLVAEIALRAHFKWRGAKVLADLAATPPPPAGAEVRLGQMLLPSRHQRLVYEMRPNLDVEYLGVEVRTNSAGWRDDEYSWLEDPQTVRILILGDSVAFGWRVAADERFGQLLEERLQSARPERDWRTLTIAAPGYNAQMEAEALLRFGLEAEPDLIIYAYVANDHCLPNFVAPRVPVMSLRSFLWFYATGRASGRNGWAHREAVVDVDSDHEGPVVWGGICSEEAVTKEYRDLVGRDAFWSAVEEIERTARSAGIPALFLNLSRSRRLIDERPLPEGYLYLDVLDARAAKLEELGGGPYMESALVAGPEDPHPSALGHRLIADELYAFLERQGWVDRTAQSR